MSRPKGSKNKRSSKILVAKDQPIVIKTDRQRKAESHYIPYEKSKINKSGNLITYQTYKADNQWLVDVFTDNKLTLSGYTENIGHLTDAVRLIENELNLI